MDFLQIPEFIAAIFIFRLEFGSPNCRFIETPDNGRVVNTPTYEVGSSIDFECIVGYEMFGQSKLMCQADGQWEPREPPTCEKMYCRSVETPDNGRVVNTPTYEIGSSIHFECIQGYEMFGQNIISCQVDGQWTPREPPTCEIKTCGEFGLIMHGYTFQEESSNGIRDSYGSIVHVTCNSGYILDGPLRVLCQADGSWGRRPKCISSKCPAYSGFNSSCIDKSGPSGPFLFFICREDVSVTRTGPDAAECIDGNWDDDLMACYCDCKINADLRLVSLNNALKGYIGHTSTLDWTCKKGHKKSVTDPLVCNDGLIGTPTCVPGEAEHAEGTPIKLPPAEMPTWIVAIVIGCLCSLCLVIAVVCYLTCKTKNMSQKYVKRSELEPLRRSV